MFVITAMLERYRKEGVLVCRPLRRRDDFQDVYKQICDVLTELGQRRTDNGKAEKPE